MKILESRALRLQGVHLLRFARFRDDRGYFTETFRRTDFDGLPFLSGVGFVQCNESYSEAGVVRGLHFQWNPHMGKLVRTVQGRMIDLVLDIRQGSPTYGKGIAVDMPARPSDAESAWIWVPPGFAHGNAFPEPTTIEYFCTGEYSPGCEAGISPVAGDIDWALSDDRSIAEALELAASGRMSDKDREGLTLEQWTADPRAQNFQLDDC